MIGGTIYRDCETCDSTTTHVESGSDDTGRDVVLCLGCAEERPVCGDRARVTGGDHRSAPPMTVQCLREPEHPGPHSDGRVDWGLGPR